jgi:hypothetical protein
LREREYPGDHEVRRVRHNGEIRWRNDLVFVSQGLVGEPVGLCEIDGEGTWRICHGAIELGIIDAVGKLRHAQGGDASPPCAPAPTSRLKNCYPCARIKALPMSPAGQSTRLRRDLVHVVRRCEENPLPYGGERKRAE